MGKIICVAVLALLVAGLAATPSRADTDQRCLALCINSGGRGPACLGQCTYNKPSRHDPASSGSAPTGHNVLTTLQPYTGIIAPKPGRAKKADKDYACVTQCLRNGEQYQQCNASCTKSSCSTGATRCKDLLGAVPSSALAATATR